VVVTAGLTTRATVLAPVFHEYVEAPDAVSVADCPTHTALAPETETVGFGFTVSVLLAVFEQVPELPITL
jgi:hypothetical protein